MNKQWFKKELKRESSQFLTIRVFIIFNFIIYLVTNIFLLFCYVHSESCFEEIL